MDITIYAKNIEVGDTLREYVEGKVQRLDRFLPNINEARIDLSEQHTRRAEERQVAQITLRAGSGIILRAEERSGDLRASLDTALDKVKRQIRRYRGKHWDAKRAPATAVEVVEEEPDAEERLVRTKTFETRPMDVDEAIEQMELLGHDFFVFYNAATSGFSVVYRRRDKGYGLLLPEAG